jgi:hypothetical protein
MFGGVRSAEVAGRPGPATAFGLCRAGGESGRRRTSSTARRVSALLRPVGLSENSLECLGELSPCTADDVVHLGVELLHESSDHDFGGLVGLRVGAMLSGSTPKAHLSRVTDSRGLLLAGPCAVVHDRARGRAVETTTRIRSARWLREPRSVRGVSPVGLSGWGSDRIGCSPFAGRGVGRLWRRTAREPSRKGSVSRETGHARRLRLVGPFAPSRPATPGARALQSLRQQSRRVLGCTARIPSDRGAVRSSRTGGCLALTQTGVGSPVVETRGEESR